MINQKPIIQLGLVLGMISALIVVALTYIIPGALFPLTVSSCIPSTSSRDFFECVPSNNIWSWLKTIITSIGFLFPAVLGFAVGLMYMFKAQYHYKVLIIIELIATMAFLVSMSVWEVIRYQPWDSLPYNRYSLNVIYGTSISLIYLFVSLFTFHIAIIISKRFWNRLVLPSFFNKKTP